MKNKTKNPFTWADLKKAINEIPDKHLHKPVFVWIGDENGCKITGIDTLNEDYLEDGDMCSKRSIIEESLSKDDTIDNYALIHEKDTRILISYED